ncbi:MAG TPA: glyoxalase/bleomycin resistance/extradiol dioxygenase family protein [Methyloceanibacter sp.]|nr:glyoxalase/bleomycin resistance/extradiol dioxygenase family protein [Methyloceanibacter sp.]
MLGGEIVAMMQAAGTPAEPGWPEDWRKKIIHARMLVDGVALMGSDCPPDRLEKMQGFSVTLNVKEPAEAERVFDELVEGGTVRIPLQETFWALKFGMLTDRFGTPWMINCEKPM